MRTKKIYIQVIPNKEIANRKKFSGADWWESGNTLHIRVAEELSENETACLIVHELCEALLCKFMGITHQQVDEFDKLHQEEEMHGLNAGDEPSSPYKIPHCLATAAERIVAGTMGLNWTEYDKHLSAL